MPKSSATDNAMVTGNYRTLEEALLSRVARLRSRDPLLPVVVLVTSRLLGLHLGRFLADRGSAHINLRFMTLEDLASRVASGALSAGGREMVPDLVPSRLISKITGELSAAAKAFYFKAIESSPGFHRAVLASIADLKNAGLCPDDIGPLLDIAGVRTKVNRAKLADFVKIWTRYEMCLAENGWYDEHDLMRAAAGLLADSDLVRQAGTLLVYGFYDFNQLEWNLLQAGVQAIPATIFVPYEKTAAYRFVEPTLERLRKMGFQPAPVARQELPVPVVLQALSRNLFSAGSAVEDEEGALTVISAPGELREIRESIRCVMRDCARDGRGLWDCAVVLRQPDVYSSIIRDQADTAGLVPYIPKGRRLSETRPGRALILLADVLTHDFSRRAVIEFASFARLKGAGAAEDDPALRPTSWDVISMEAGIIGGRREWQERLETLHADTARAEEDEPGWRRTVPGSEQAVAGLREFIETLSRGLAPVENGRSWREKTGALRAVYDSLVEPESDTEEILASLECLADLDAIEAPAGVDDYIGTLRDLLDTRRLRPGSRFQRTGPAVLDLMAARGVSFDTVILPGLVEKGFPPVIRQDAILLDHEREALNTRLSGCATTPVTPKARQRLDEERLLFTLAVGSALRKLILTYPRIEMITAKERLASSFLLATMEAVTGSKPDFDGLESLKGFERVRLSRIAVETPAEALDEVEFDLSAALRGIAAKEAAAIQHLRDLSPIFGHALELESQRWGRNVFTRYDGLVASDGGEELLRKYSMAKGEISPSGLETYATCPYQYLLGRVMRIHALVEPERTYVLNPLDRGDLVHRILWRFFTGLFADTAPSRILEEDDRASLHAAAGKEFDDFESRGMTGFPALWSLEKDRILGWLEELFDEELEETRFRPTYFEVRYGMRRRDPCESPISTREPVPFTLGGCRIMLKGRIDRIDISRDDRAARVIDYKTGQADSKTEDSFLGGTSLQLPLYIEAAAHLLKRNNSTAEPEYAEYYCLKSRRKKRVRFEASAMTAKRDELESILRTIIDSADRGRFFARPGGHCEHCDFLGICGHVRWAVFEMKSKDPNMQSYLALGQQPDGRDKPGRA